MPVIYVVDVPEFLPIVEAARKKPQCRVSGGEKGYYKVEWDGEVVFNRREMKMKPALWFGMFTGGLDGEIKSFNIDEVVVIGTNKSL